MQAIRTQTSTLFSRPAALRVGLRVNVVLVLVILITVLLLMQQSGVD